MKKIYSVIIAVVLILSVFTGCSKTDITATNPTPVETAIVTTDASAIETTSPSTEITTPTPTETPTKEPINTTEETTPIVTQPETTVDERLALAPDITGLTKQIQNEDVVYLDNSGNYAGVFKDNVLVEGVKTGGVALVASEAQKILEAELAKISEGQNKLKVIVPIDIANLNGTEEISIYSALCTKVNKDCLIVDLSNNVNLVNTIPGESHFFSSSSSTNLDFILKDGSKITINNLGSFPNDKVYSEELTSENSIYHLTFLLPRDSFSVHFNQNFTFGDNFNISINSPMVIACGSKEVFSLEISDLLYVGKCPVFITQIPSSDK